MTAGTRLLICGGRDYSDLGEIYNVIAGIFPEVVIHGAARGADSIAGKVADELGLETEVYPAEWDKYGKSAGYRRNAQMLKEGEPTVVVAFPGGKGTQMMIDLAKKDGVPVLLAGVPYGTSTLPEFTQEEAITQISRLNTRSKAVSKERKKA